MKSKEKGRRRLEGSEALDSGRARWEERLDAFECSCILECILLLEGSMCSMKYEICVCLEMSCL